MDFANAAPVYVREANLGLSRATIARTEVRAEAFARELALSLDHALHFFAGLPCPTSANHPSMQL